jgi:hypothetical protein
MVAKNREVVETLLAVTFPDEIEEAAMARELKLELIPATT